MSDEENVNCGLPAPEAPPWPPLQADPYTVEEGGHQNEPEAVTSSEIGKILGVDVRHGPLELYCIKRGIMPEDQGDESALWGTRLQKEVAKAYAEENGLEVEWLDKRHRSKERPWQVGTPDAIASNPEIARRGVSRLLEVKCRASSKGWGASGSDEVPLGVMAQVMWCMDIMGLPSADIAVLFGGMQMKVYTVPYNPLIARDLRDAALVFLNDYVKAGVAPAPLPTREAARALSALYANPDKVIADADEVERKSVDLFLTLKAAHKKAEKDFEDASLIVKAMVGDRLGLQSEKWRLTWTPVKGRKSIAWEALYLDKVGDAPSKEQIEKFTVTGNPYRRMTEKVFGKQEDDSEEE